MADKAGGGGVSSVFKKKKGTGKKKAHTLNVKDLPNADDRHMCGRLRAACSLPARPLVRRAACF